jgi:hypothetical protein
MPMKKVLIVKGTTRFDVYELRDMLRSRGIACVDCRWDEVGGFPDEYDLAVHFGLDDWEKNKAHLFLSTVRRAVGPDAKLLVVSQWDRVLMTKEHLKEKYGAEYFSRGDSHLTLLDTVLGMLKEEAKTAPC